MAKSNVELVIRARNEASKALRSISDAIKDVTKDQKTLAGQAGSTESRLGELGRELGSLDERLKSLRSAGRLAGDLDKTTTALNRQKAATQQAQLRYTELAKTVSDTERPTKRLQNQLAAAERRLASNREKTAALEQTVAGLAQQYDAARADLGGMVASEDDLARSTARAAAEFTALQTQIRELRKVSKGAAAADLSGLDVPGLARAGEAISSVGRRVREAGNAADLTAVDLKTLSAEVDQLEGVAKDIGELRQMAATFAEMRRESLETRRVWKELEGQTKALAQEFAAADQPSQELAQRLGEARAASRQAKSTYEQTRASVKQFGDVLRAAGVDVSDMAAAQKTLDAQLETTAQVMARSRVELDRLSDEQASLAKAQGEAAAASEKEQEARQEALKAGSRALRVYRQTKGAVEEARTAYEDATKQVTRIATAMREADQPTAAMTREFEKAKKRAGELKDNFRAVQQASGLLARTLRENKDDAEALVASQQQLETALDRSASRLNKAGTEASAAEQRLQEFRDETERARKAATELGQGAEAAGQGVDRFAEQARQAEAAMRAFRDQGRTTLSLLQRMRGQVLALASAYVGLYGVGSGVASVADAQIGLEATQSRLRVAVGDDPEKVAEELKFVRQVADELKLEFRGLSEEYSKFAAASRGAGASAEETRAIFLALAKAGRVNKLSSDEMRRAINAVTQMMSKGKISAEELRQQLGEVLPGAFDIFAKSIGVTGGELDKMLKEGSVRADSLVYFARELEKRFGEALPGAVESTSAKIAEFRNTIYDLKLIIAQSGFIDSLGDSLERVTEELAKPEAQEGARELGRAIGSLIESMVDMLDYMDELILGLKLLAAALGVKWGLNLVAGIAEAIRSLRKFRAAAGLATVAVRGLWQAITGIGLLLAGWSIAEWAAKEFPAFGRYWAAFKATLFTGLLDLKAKFQVTAVEIKDVFSGNIKALGSIILKAVASWAERLSKLFSFVGADSIADGLKSLSSTVEEYAFDGLSDAAQKKVAEIKAELAKAKKELDDKYFAEFQQRTKALTGGSGTGPSLTPAAVKSAGQVTGLTVEGILGHEINPSDYNSGDGDTEQQAKERADAVIAEAKRVTAAVNAELERQKAELERTYDDSLITVQEYYDERTRIAKEKIDAEIRQLRTQMAELQRADPAATNDSQIRRQSQIADIQARIVQLTRDKAEAEKQFAHMAQQARADLLDQARRLRNQVLIEQGNELQAQLNRNQDQYEKLIKAAEKLSGVEGERMRKNAEIWKSLSDQSAAITAARRHADDVARAAQAASAIMDAMLEAGKTAGDITDLEALRIEGHINEEKIRELEKVKQAYAGAGKEGAAAAMRVQAQIIKLKAELDPLANKIRGIFEDQFTTMFKELGQAIANGESSLKDVFRNLGANLAGEFADMFAKEASQQLMKAFKEAGLFDFLSGLIINKDWGTKIAKVGASVFSSLAYHDGGIAGSPGQGQRRMVSPSWFSNAVRYHEGGIAGLRPGEVPAILERGEEVLTKDNPRHSTNGGGGNQGAIKIVNTFDAGEMVSAGLNTSAGEKVIMNFMSRNRQKIKRTLG